ncbi:efflux RND transporter periplasmic adaptor subunit [Daejeonella sp.]|uniref:efflux RND transporter periplasmic adaptor subunit n=1 Tax=Daejeonella sp. TaxID=2805397 RepID=UPI00272174F9|nr:HlyD family efflux transporter periplasmic adaptor subunit [Daejeonella sp.]MDO8993952.1 HlyD family efflux transporter periplasmic adaptor subunit [Daejeonella sp.]MDP2414258.1 HlyD family efflux transporter periplasmic adaptor subunit [Daejeonella sp.]
MRNNYLLGLAIALSSCNSSGPKTEIVTEPQTPVTVTTVKRENLEEYAELNATSSFMEKSVVKAGISGYIQSQPIQKGKYVQAGQVLFTLITKEARAIGNTINKLDPSFKFSGITTVRASKSGFISVLSHQKGDFVPEGEQLAVISNNASFVFLMDVPYELSSNIRSQSAVQLTLPDGEILKGSISSALPSVDSLSQTQRVIIKVNPSHSIPENLIAKAKIVKNAHSQAASLPRESVLANETQDKFWVMKLLNDTIAVKILVKKGMETIDRIEIIEPTFKPDDRIIVTGNYGLADTAKVKIVKN